MVGVSDLTDVYQFVGGRVGGFVGASGKVGGHWGDPLVRHVQHEHLTLKRMRKHMAMH